MFIVTLIQVVIPATPLTIVKSYKYFIPSVKLYNRNTLNENNSLGEKTYLEVYGELPRSILYKL